MKPTLTPDTTHSYAISDLALTDLANSMLNLRASAQSYPRMDSILQATLDYAADAMQAILDLADAQHPVQEVAGVA